MLSLLPEDNLSPYLTDWPLIFVVQSLSLVRLFATPKTAGFPFLHHLPELMSMSQWWHSNILSSVIPFSSCLQFFPVSASFLVNQFFASVSQSFGASASASVFPMNSQGWFPLRLTDLISLQSKEFSRVFSSTIIWKNQFFGAQPSFWSNSHIHTWLL